ncbi:MAG: polynucleotide adenylyltransferase PcnB [Candidatus Accumulibacter sp.]|jgi:poly(A) polymerase|uniref:polynucleotide adenylyltransferase PcnB n=1 Tax=unclassified Candidatus Accumulibacter TaxID=2619054 RepID=UPI001A53ADB1|nr:MULTISPECIES: polynucleotide adenylyltransferase PcnB [unclassified Candidatus Accumulibacter]MBL8368666.1 polynucleotide adenylyltransferase PcnB [Accumulibacter sp.]HRI93264.1 polynucleotide adenylyltransferase PcnB [Accumulibacter sp.]
MIRKFISRVLGRKNAGNRNQPAIIAASQHGLQREQISRGCRQTVEALQENGYQAYIVGGAVRDLLAGLTPKDFDVATNATPEQVRRCFRRSRIIGRRFQIVHVNMGVETIEVTTFRGHHGEQGEHGGNKAQTDAQGRLLRDNVFGSQSDDAARRDFTVNALYYDPSSETIIDYHHGVADLQQKTLRMIGDPKTRYREDPVRMLRAVRLAAKIGLAIDPAARRPIREMADLLDNVPPSRLFDEMLKLLTSGHALRCVTRLREEGLHAGVLPLLDVILEQPLGERFVALALEATDRRVEEGKPISPGFLFATLLWHQVLATWEPLKSRGEPPIPSLFVAMDEVLHVQAEKLAITRRIAGDIKDIWGLQPRFEQRSGKRPYGVLQQPRFKAGYDFLLLRAESGEIDPAIGDWWSEFLHAGDEARAEMLLPAAPASVKKRRRRRRRPADDSEQKPDAAE